MSSRPKGGCQSVADAIQTKPKAPQNHLRFRDVVTSVALLHPRCRQFLQVRAKSGRGLTTLACYTAIIRRRVALDLWCPPVARASRAQ